MGLAVYVAPARADDPPPPTVTIRAGESESPTVIDVDFDELPLHISLDADVDNEPVSNAECTISGPTYEWSGPGIDGQSGSGATLTWTTEESGEFTIGAGVAVKYKSECEDGNDTDIPLSDSASFTVRVHKKKWQTHLGIGKYIVKSTQPDGTVTESEALDGRMTAPQDQTKNPYVPAVVWTPVGKKISCSVESATDLDLWTRRDESEVVEDTVKYSWTATGGSFQGSTDGQSATWVAPDEPGPYTVTCRLDDKAEMEAGYEPSRDDDYVDRSVTIIVAKKTWSPGTAIGTIVNTNENGDVETVYSGRMRAPQDQTKNPYVPQNVKSILKTVLSCSVEDANDEDKWEYKDAAGNVYQTGKEADEIESYLWEGGDGVDTGFVTGWQTVNGQPVPILATTHEGASAPWYSGVTGTFSITCTIKDKPLDIKDDEAGERGDADLVRTVSVLVYDPESYAKLNLYRFHPTAPSNLGDEVTGGTSGGTVIAVLEVQVGGQKRIDDAQGGLRLRIEELHSIHDDSDNHTNFPIGLGGTWQKYNATSGTWTDTGVPKDANNGTTPLKYRLLMPWNTGAAYGYSDPDGEGPIKASSLQGHNGSHMLELYKWNEESSEQIRFEDINAPAESTGEGVGPNSASLNVENLVIDGVSSSNGTQDYFKWDPESGVSSLANPTINFTIKDEGEPGKYRCVIFFTQTANVHSTSSTNWKNEARKIVKDLDGKGSHSINLTEAGLYGRMFFSVDANGTVSGDGRAPYTYDIRVVKFPSNVAFPADKESEQGNVSAAEFKQPYLLWIPHQFGNESGHNVWLEDIPEGGANIRANYALARDGSVAGIPANNVELTAMDPAFDEKGAIGGETGIGQFYNGVDENGDATKDGLKVGRVSPTDFSGNWRVIFTAEDGAAQKRRRDHTASRMIPVNKPVPTMRMDFGFYDGDPYSDPAPTGKKLGFDIPWGSQGLSGTMAYGTAGKPATAYFYLRPRGRVFFTNSDVNTAPATDTLVLQRIKRHPTTGNLVNVGTPVTKVLTRSVLHEGQPGERNFVVYYMKNSYWDVTSALGRWDLKSSAIRRWKGHTVKINKREQVGQFAEAWKGKKQEARHETPPVVLNGNETYHGGPICPDLVLYCYNHVGLGLGTSALGSVPDTRALMEYSNGVPINDGRRGSAFFYWRIGPKLWGHTGVNIGSGQIVDQNCPHDHSKYKFQKQMTADGWKDVEVGTPEIDEHSATHPAVVAPGPYAAPKSHAPKALRDLDWE